MKSPEFSVFTVNSDSYKHFSTMCYTYINGFRIYLQFVREKYWHYRTRSITFVLWMIRNVIILVNWAYKSLYFNRYKCRYINIYIYTHTHTQLVLFYVHKILDFSIWSISEITIQPQDIKMLILFQNVKI